MSDPKTERLDAERPSTEEHREFLVDLFTDPEVAGWHWPGVNPGGGPRSPGQSRELHHRSIAHWEEHGHGWWLWRDRCRGELVAHVGVVRKTIDGEAAVELGWSVPVAEQGRGHATEAAIASLEFGFAEAGLDEIVTLTWIENAASQRVMQKAGFDFQRDLTHAGLPHVLYVARSGEWSPPEPPAAAVPGRVDEKRCIYAQIVHSTYEPRPQA